MSSIDNLKATIGKKGGLARNNRFQVIFTPPQASLVNTDPSVLLGTLASGGGAANIINDPRDISFLCESVTLPGRVISTIDYQAESKLVKMPYTYIDSAVNMTFILTNDYYARTLFENWYSAIFDVENYKVGYKKDYSTDVIIQQLNSKNIPVYGVKLEKAFPIEVSPIELTNAQENDYLRLQVTFAYDNYINENLLESIGSAAESIGGQVSNTAGIFG